MDNFELVSEGGALNAAALADLQLQDDLNVTVVCTLSAHAVSQGSLLNRLFGAELPSDVVRGIGAALIPVDDAAALVEPGRQMVLLNVEQFDAPGGATRIDERARAAHFGLALADVLLFSLRAQDLARPQAAGVSALQTSFAEMLRVAPRSGGVKRLFIVLVTEYEEDVLSRDALISGFMEVLQAVYDGSAKPPRAPARLLEVFDFEFVTLPVDDADAVFNTRRRLMDSAGDDYFFERGQYGRRLQPAALAKLATDAWAALADEDEADLPDSLELTAAFDCDAVMRRVFDEYSRAVRDWRRDADGGAVVDNFGQLASTLKKEIVDLYDRDAAAHRKSTAWKRKRAELHTLVDDDLYMLYAAQVGRLRDSTYRAFKETLDGVTDGDSSLERKVGVALRDAQKAFRAGVTNLRPRGASWRSDADIGQLATQMKEEAAERVQRARIAEYAEGGARRRRLRVARGNNRRQPVALGIHYLNPAPFGYKDSRFEKLGLDDNLAYRPAPKSSDAVASLPKANGNSTGLINVPLMPERGSQWNSYT